MAQAGTAERLGTLRIDRSKIRTRHRWRRLVLAGSGLVVAILIALAVFGRPPTVTIAQVREARVGEQQTDLTAAGYVASRRRSVVAPKVPGRLDALLVDEGQRVEKGEVIARLDPTDAKVAVDRARAEERAAQAAYVAAQAEQDRAARELTRQKTLYAGAATARSALDQAQSNFDAAQAQVGAARARRDAAIEVVAQAQLGVENTVVRAPFTGTVVRKLADEGAVLAPAAISTENVGGIVELVDLSQLEVEAEVGEDSLSRVRIGQPALLVFDAFPDRAFRGRVESLRPTIEKSKATGTVKVSFVDTPQNVLPDMAARVSFLKEPLPQDALSRGAELRVPASSVIERDGRPVVFAIESETVSEVPVRLGERVGDEVVLVEGPKPGTQLVERPGPRLRGGSRVRVQVEGG